jgi:hypothetical protein
MKWETIVCYRDESAWGSYQVLSPREWDALTIAAGIDEGSLAGLVTPDKRTILGELGDRDHLELQHVGLS